MCKLLSTESVRRKPEYTAAYSFMLGCSEEIFKQFEKCRGKINMRVAYTGVSRRSNSRVML
jgi:hypothetical protein